MYLMYVDESGDCGLANSPTRFFVVTGMVLHELRWRACLEELIRFRRDMRQRFGLRLREEFHASAFLTRPGKLIRIRRHDRLAMIRAFADALAAIPDISLINVVVDKAGKLPTYDVFEWAWKVLIQRFENTINRHNFPGPRNPDDRGALFCDHTTEKKIVGLVRKMRQFNPIPNQVQLNPGYRNLPLSSIVEDPSFRNSAHSYFVQAADLAAYLVYQRHAPNVYMRKNSGQNYFDRLRPVLCLHATGTNPEGIVRL